MVNEVSYRVAFYKPGGESVGFDFPTMQAAGGFARTILTHRAPDDKEPQKPIWVSIRMVTNDNTDNAKEN